MAQTGIKKCQIGALKPGNSDLSVVALVINKPDPKKVVMKKDGGERWVSTFTLRDSASDMINLTIWSSGEEAAKLKAEFKIGMVVEVVKPKVMSREVVGGRDAAFNPQVTSPFQLSFQEGRSMLCPHLADAPHLTQLLNVPSKASSTFLSISDIITNSGALKGHFVDMLVAVRKVGEVKKFTNKQDGQERGVREVRLFDQTADSLLLKLWDSEFLRMADDWLPREVILFLADARIDWDDYRSSFVLTATSKTVSAASFVRVSVFALPLPGDHSESGHSRSRCSGALRPAGRFLLPGSARPVCDQRASLLLHPHSERGQRAGHARESSFGLGGSCPSSPLWVPNQA